MTQRTERIDELLREEITTLLTREIADPRIGFATVTDVETAPDLRHAKVWVSVIGQPEDRAATVRALEHAMPFVRRELGKRLRLRRIPEFSVRLDESIERGSRILKLISEIEAGELPDALPEGESLPTPTVRMPHEGDAADALAIPDAPAAGAGRRANSRKPAAARRGPKNGDRAPTARRPEGSPRSGHADSARPRKRP
jgi:ribosome-binding factor A